MFVYIYKLIKKDAINDDMIYIGSTGDIEARMIAHKCSCNNIKSRNYNNKVYKYMRDNGGWDAWTYEIIDEVEVALRNDAVRYEGEYIIKYDAINKLNEIVAGRTHKEYYEQNREQIKQQHKEYHEQNKERLSQKRKEQTKQYYQQNNERISQKYKEYYQQNKEQLLQKKKEYQNKNKDAINERRREQRRLAKLNTL